MFDIYYHKVPGYNLPLEFNNMKIKRIIIVSDYILFQVHNMIKKNPEKLWRNYIYYRSLINSKKNVVYPSLIPPQNDDSKRTIYYSLVDTFNKTKDILHKSSLYIVLKQFSQSKTRFVYGNYKINPPNFIGTYKNLMELHLLFNQQNIDFDFEVRCNDDQKVLIQVTNTIDNQLKYIEKEIIVSEKTLFVI